jgi:hypothetical protein
MSCGHDHGTCDHHADTGHEQHLPAVGDHRPPDAVSGCCGGRGHADRAEPQQNPAR